MRSSNEDKYLANNSIERYFQICFQIFSGGRGGGLFWTKNKKNEILNLLKNRNEIDNFCSIGLFGDALAMFISKNKLNGSQVFEVLNFEN